jgi:tetratricopeptide (TPR) repeat protein
MNGNGPYLKQVDTQNGIWFVRTLRINPNEPSLLNNWGKALPGLKGFEDARATNGKTIGHKPDEAEAFNSRGNALRALRRFDEALASYDRAIALKPDYADAFYNRGITFKDLKRFEEALASYDKVIALQPHYAKALNNRGNALQALKRFEESLASYDRAIAIEPDYIDAFYNRGIALQELKRFEEALASSDKVITLKPDAAEAFNNKGNALGALKRFGEALASFEQAIALRPNYAEAFNNRGNALRALKRLDAALASYDRAIVLKPDYADAVYSRGSALRELKRFDEAVASYDKVIALKPDHADAFYDRGNALKEIERFDEALASYNRAIALGSDSAAAFNNRGNVLQELTRFEEALASYDHAVTLDPDYAEAFYNRGNVLQELKRFDDALATYDKAIALKPDYAEAFNSRGHLLKDEGKRAEAVIDFEQALALKPDFADAKIAVCMAQLPILYMDAPEIAGRRAAYQACLESLCDDVDRRGTRPDLAKAIGSSQPFFLAYQGHNDRDLQSIYGSLVCRIMAERYPPAALSPPPRSDEPVRLGIVSGFFRQHSNWKIPIKGWLSQIDRRRFRVFGYYTGIIEDSATQQAAALCDRFVQGPLSIDRWREAILHDAPHVLIYPEVGMNAVSARLAAQRLAPVQCNSWGHPDTSGFPTLDYYLSSDLMEPPRAQDHYTERLVRLPNLSIYYEQLDAQPVSLHRTDLGLRSSATIYWCGQSLFKYLPQFDQVFPRIAREAGECQFAFIQYDQGTYLNERFFQRLDRAFAAFGLKAADYCVLLPRLDTRRFVAAIGLCDIVLDSIGWSGCNSTLEGLHHDLPIVTMTGPLMRGRHSMAILKMMDVDETLTGTVDDYVSTAIRLARDLPWRTAVKNRISENKHRLYRDTSCVSALQKFLDGVVRGAV